MDVEGEIGDLATQKFALTTVVIALCQYISKISPELAAAVKTAFDDAANHTERIGFIMTTAPLEHFTKSVRIIEEMRAAILGKQTKPRDIV